MTLTTLNYYMRTLLYSCASIGLVALGIFFTNTFLDKNQPVPTEKYSMPNFAIDYTSKASCVYHMDRCESLPGLATYYAWPYGFSFMFPSDITIKKTTLINERLLAILYQCSEAIPCGNTELFIETTTDTSLSAQTIKHLYLIDDDVTIIETTPFVLEGKHAHRAFVLQKNTLVPDTVIQILNGPQLISFISKGTCDSHNCLARSRELSTIFLSSIRF